MFVLHTPSARVCANAIRTHNTHMLLHKTHRYVGKVMNFATERRGELIDHVVLGGERTMLKYTLPLSELGGNFYDELKSLTSGFASFDYEEGVWGG